MEEKTRNVCRLCLNIVLNDDYLLLEASRIVMLGTILPHMDLYTSEGQIICNYCTEFTEKCHSFKISCLNTEDAIISYANQHQVPGKVNLKEIVVEKLTKQDSDQAGWSRCRLCLSVVDDINKLQELGDEIVFKLKKCVPELDLFVTGDPHICETCLSSVDCYFSFLMTICDVEERIRTYCSSIKYELLGKIDLNDVLNYFESQNLKMNFEKETKNGYDEAMVKSESVETGISAGLQCDELRNDAEQNILESISPATNAFPCKHCSYKAGDKRDLKIHSLEHSKAKHIYQCSQCSFITRHNNVIRNHQLTHKNIDEIDWQQCTKCTFRTKLKCNLQHHLKTHDKLSIDSKRFKCEQCDYSTLWKRDLERHIVKHKNPEDITMYKCDFCAFTTKYQRYLKQHVDKLHMKTSIPSEEVYRCAQCDYTTKSKRCLVPHMVTHRKDLVFNCSVCPYKTNRKECLKKHEVIHKIRYKCDVCDFETNLKRYLTQHELAHKALEATPILRCDKCSYQSRYKQGLKNHSLVHKTKDEIEMSACPHCDYASKRLFDLKNHISAMHTNSAVVYSCEHCSYRTKYKTNFRQHNVRMHGSVSEIKMFKCEHCSFETKYKSSLKSHFVSYHKKLEEITMLKCKECDFLAKRKDSLRVHMEKHKTSELFKCGQCVFQTKYKRALKKHLEGHENVTMLKCNLCEFQTQWRQTLSKHEMTHGELGGIKEQIVVETKTEEEEYTVKKEFELVKMEAELNVNK